MSTLLDWAQTLQDTDFATQLAQSRYEFPILEGFHLIGLSLSVGLILLIDLRLAGWFLKPIPEVTLLRQLRPWSLVGFVLTFVSGLALLSSEAVSVINSPPFAFKLLFLALAGANALYFEWRLLNRRSGSKPVSLPDRGTDTLALGRVAQIGALASLSLWLLVIATGRLIPYIPSW